MKMPKEQTGFYFRVSANLLRIIGQELVASDEAAIWELVKNAYDSNARRVTITIESVSEKTVGFLRIADDGQGMSRKDFERLFMVAGSSERPEEAADADRVPTGEKGIGRFAASRLGDNLRVLTRSDSKEPDVLEVIFDWRKFRDKKKRFDKVLIPYAQVKTSELPKNQTGTILEITRLHNTWKREKIEKLRGALAELLDPFNKPSDFELAIAVLGSEKLSGPVSQQPPKEADLELEFRVLADKRVSRKLSAVASDSENHRESVSSSANTEPLVGLAGRFLYYFSRPPKAKTMGLSPAVRIYRDGVHLEPFGSPTADWLGISARRAKRAGHAHIVPSRLYGFVEISRIKHQELKDTTGRQALIDNEAAQSLVTVLHEQLTFLEDKVRTRVSEPKWEAGKRQKIIKLERARLHSLGMLSAGLGHELRQPLQVVRTQTGNIGTRLAELNVRDTEIAQSQEAIDRNIQRMHDSINYIGDLARGDVERVDNLDLAEHLRQDARFFENQCRAKGINLVIRAPDSQPARISQTGFSMVLLNLWTNAVEALEEKTEENGRQITITLAKTGANNILEVTDNGPGINDEMRKNLFKEFETEKTGGMGIGLYTCSLIVRAHGGEINYDTRIGLGTTFRVRFPDS
jgi:signal transduction histidine kinase